MPDININGNGNNTQLNFGNINFPHVTNVSVGISVTIEH